MPRLLPFQGISSVLNRLWYQSLYIVSNCLAVINAASHWPPQLSGWDTLSGPCILCCVSARARGIQAGRSYTSQMDGQTPGTYWSCNYRCPDSSVQNGLQPRLRDVRTSWPLVGERDTGEQAKETSGTSYFPDSPGPSHWGCASTDSTPSILPATGALLLTFLLLLQCLWPVHVQ